MGPNNEGKEDGANKRSHKDASNFAAFEYIRKSPDHRDKESNEGNIRISICHCLIAYLYQADNRHQGAEILEPAHKKVRTT